MRADTGFALGTAVLGGASMYVRRSSRAGADSAHVSLSPSPHRGRSYTKACATPGCPRKPCGLALAP